MDMEREVLIDQMLFEQPVDLQKLFEASRLEGGYLTDNIRKRVWPKILAVNRYSTIDYRSYLDPEKDFAYIECDIARSLFSYDHLLEWDDAKREKRRESLADIIKCILSKYPKFHYFQGFHDIVSIFLLVLEDDQLTFSMVEVVSLYFFSDYMSEDFKIVSRGMNILMLILEIADPEVHAHISDAGVEAYFCTAWMLTWFSHDMRQIEEVARVFDALLCSHPLFILYLCAALVLHYRDEVLECECEFSSLHNLLVHLAKRPSGIPFEAVLAQADHWMTVIPPRALKAVMARGDLRDLLVNNKFHLLTKPEIPRYVDADWVLLQAHKLGETNRAHPSPPSPADQSQHSSKKRGGWMPKLYSKKSVRSEAVPPIQTGPPDGAESPSPSPASSPADSITPAANSPTGSSSSPTTAGASANVNFSASIYLTSPRDSEFGGNSSDGGSGRGGKTFLGRLRKGAASFFSTRKDKSSTKPVSPPKAAVESALADDADADGDTPDAALSVEHTAATTSEGAAIADDADASGAPPVPSWSPSRASTTSVVRRRRSSAASSTDENEPTPSRGSLLMMRERPSSLYMKEPLNFNPAFDEKDSPAYIWLQKTGYLRYLPASWDQFTKAATGTHVGTTLVLVAVAVGVAGIGYQLSLQHNSQSLIQK